MELVRYQRCFDRLLIGVLLATLLTAPCAAQESYPPDDRGFGNAPMAPATPGSYYQPTVPGPPSAPQATTRPQSWPGSPSPVAASQATPTVLPPARELTLCEGSRILAHVGSEVILDSDVAGPVNDFMIANKDRIPPEQADAIREEIIKKQLKGLVQAKLVFLDAKHAIPSENWSQVEKQVAKMFEASELDKLMKRVGADSRAELDEKLRKLGTSLEHEKKAFFERELSGEWIRKQIKRDDEITYDQMVTYYRQHLGEFTTPARVKWEELMVRTVKYPSDDAALAALAQMGNQVLAGTNLAEVAKGGSDGPTAYKGGAWDWTIKGSLVCQEIDRALFSLPVGQLSPIIKGQNGFHIVRVTARDDVRVSPFLEAQVDIREKIVKQRSDKQLHEYLAKLESRTPVSTIYDVQSDAKETMTNRLYGGPQIRR
jgi:parvulin-like peptidyl-prolyl isomerase